MSCKPRSPFFLLISLLRMWQVSVDLEVGEGSRPLVCGVRYRSDRVVFDNSLAFAWG